MLPLLNRRVLVVDDDPDYLSTMVHLLLLLGCVVHEARDGASALRVAADAQPDVVLVDLRLPDMSGHALAAGLRQRVANPDLLVIAVTGDGLRDARESSVDAGIDLHLLKPLDLDQLLEALRAPPPRAPVARGEHTILVVDDEAAGRYALVRGLGAAGFRVEEAASGREAMALLRGGPPSALVLDVCLPDVDGRDLCQQLRAHGDTARLPIVHMSAVFVGSGDMEAGRRAGSDAYFVAPVRPNTLARTLDVLIAARG